MTLRRAATFAIRGFLVLVALVLAAGLAYRLYGLHRHAEALGRFRAEVGSLNPKDYAPPDVPMLENAATWIRRGVEAVVVFEEEKSAVGTCEDEGPSALDAAGRATVEEVIARNGPAFELLAHGATLPRSEWGLDYARGSQAKLPDLLAAITSARLLACDGRLALDRDDLDRAARRFEQLGAVARVYETEPVMIVQLIGTAIERIQLFLGRDLLWRGVASESALSPVDIEAQMRRAFALEAATTEAVVRGDVPLRDPQGTAYSPAPSERIAMGFFGPAEAAEYLAMWTAIHDATRKPWVEGNALARRATSLPSGPVVIPNTLDAFGRTQATRTLREGLRTGIELRRLGERDGRYPPSIPSSLGEIAIDRLTGRPLAYTVRPDGSARLEREHRPDETKGILDSARFDGFYWELPSPGASR